MMKKVFILLAILATIFASINSEEADFVVELLSPQGFRVATKNLPGVQRVGFRGNINKELLGHGTAQYTGDFALRSDDWWVYENPSASLNPGDMLYFRPQMLSHTAGVLHFAQQFHVPIDTVVTDTVVTDAVPIDAVVTDAVPIDAVVTDAVPIDSVVTDAVPIDAVVTDGVPIDAVVTDAVPIDAAVTDALPTDIPLTNALQENFETTEYSFLWF